MRHPCTVHCALSLSPLIGDYSTPVAAMPLKYYVRITLLTVSLVLSGSVPELRTKQAVFAQESRISAWDLKGQGPFFHSTRFSATRTRHNK